MPDNNPAPRRTFSIVGKAFLLVPSPQLHRNVGKWITMHTFIFHTGAQLNMRLSPAIAYLCLYSFLLAPCLANEQGNVPIWTSQAPGETTSEPGTALPLREADNPPISRIEKITQPTLDVFLAEKPNGTGLLILPGGGFRYVVPDLEGSEAAKALNPLGISVFVLRYRTSTDATDAWKKPLQDSQRAMRYLRANADKFHLNKERIGLLGFSAGGQVAAIHATQQNASYISHDEIDALSFRPDFLLLIYPWRIYDANQSKLIESIHVTKSVPPTFIVHTHDDQSTSIGAALFYIELKKLDVPAELHIYFNGGHGYGVRPRKDSAIGTWQNRSIEWLQLRKLARP